MYMYVHAYIINYSQVRHLPHIPIPWHSSQSSDLPRKPFKRPFTPSLPFALTAQS